MKKYEELAEKIKKNIPRLLESGDIRLPPELAAMDLYHVSRQTVRRAYALLEEEKLIHSIQGSGTYLTGLLPDRQSNQIAVLLTTDTEYIYPQLHSSLGRILSQKGFAYTIHTTGGSIDRERQLLLSLLKKKPRGLIAEGCCNALPSPNLDLYRQLQSLGTSVLFLYGRYPNDTISIEVKDANEQGGYDLTEYLLRRGHRHIAGIFQSDTLQGRERYFGYTEALRTYRAPLPSDNILWFHSRQLTDLQLHQDTRFLQEFAKQYLASCSAVVCHNDEIAYYLIRELRSAGIRVPGDISIVGFDNSYLQQISSIRLTTLAHETQTVSEAVSGTILRMIRSLPVSSVELPWTLITGNSEQAMRN